MSHAFLSDAAEKILIDLSPGERAAVESARQLLEADPAPRQARRLPEPGTSVIELLPEQTAGRGISIVYRHSHDLDATLILWLIAGP